MLLDKFQYLLGDTGVGTDVATIQLPVAQLFHLCILGWHDANGDLRRLAEVRTIECNGRNRPTPQSLPGFLAQALEEPNFHHIAPSSDAPGRSRAPLLDHLVGEREQLVWNLEGKRPGGPQIDREIELGRLLDRDIAGRGPTQNLGN